MMKTFLNFFIFLSFFGLGLVPVFPAGLAQGIAQAEELSMGKEGIGKEKIGREEIGREEIDRGVIDSVVEFEEQESLDFNELRESAEDLLPLEGLMSSSLLEDEEESQDFSAFWKAVFKGRSFGANYKLNAIFITEFYGKLHWNILDTISVNAKALFISRNGFTSSIYERGDRKDGRLYFLEGFLTWDFLPQIFLKVGTIQQSFLNAPLLITDTSFPSIIGGWSKQNPYADVSILVQSAIPDNAESVNRPNQLGGLPLFLTSSVLLHSENVFFQSDIKEIFSLYYYHNLSSDVADNSKIYGNTITGLGESSEFEYGFFGIHNNINIKRPLSDLWIFELGWEFLYNFKAEALYNEGTRIYSSFYHNYKNFMELRLKGEVFANQADTSVAYYNSEIYGHNDRIGFLSSIQSHLYRSGLTLEASFVYSQPINNKAGNLGPAYSITFSMMTNYLAI